MKRTIEIDDTLDDIASDTCDEVKEYFQEWLDENKPDELPCLHNNLDYDGRIDEIVDSAVPIYYHEINTAWYLHSNRLEEAYEYAGVGNNPRENNGTVAIYYFIEQAVNEWYNANAQDLFDIWEAKQS